MRGAIVRFVEKVIKRHKCFDERLKPVCEQRGAIQCYNCRRWAKEASQFMYIQIRVLKLTF